MYLLGLYLGDGCISAHPRGVFKLRICLDLRYPGIVDACEAAMKEVLPTNSVGRQERIGGYLPRDEPSNVEVYAYSKRWPCLFPQHGPGKKHDRPILLSDWQGELVGRDPEQLLRGLIHSDGCRFINTGRGGWSCPRYSFSNLSGDIREIFCTVCDSLSLHWTRSGHSTVYVSRRADVERMDAFIGAKA